MYAMGGPADFRTTEGERVVVHRQFSEIATAWKALAAQPCYVFQTYEWLSLWNETSSQAENVEPFIVRIADSHDRTLAIFPLGIRHRYGCCVLVFLGGEVTDYNAPLFDPAAVPFYNKARLNLLWDRIEMVSGADAVWLQRMPARLPNGANPMITERHTRQVASAYAASSLPSSFAAFAATRKSTFFADTRRRRRQLERLGSLKFELADSPQEAAAIVALMLRQKRRRQEETAGRLLLPHQQRFYESLATTTFADGEAHVASLRVGDKIVATHVGVVHQNRFYYLMPGYEAGEWARYSVGRQLLQSLVEWCIARGIESFDLTVGDEEYKRFWADQQLALYESRYALNVRGACYLGATWLKDVMRRTGNPERALSAPPTEAPAAAP